jgi:hypothetical protein
MLPLTYPLPLLLLIHEHCQCNITKLLLLISSWLQAEEIMQSEENLQLFSSDNVNDNENADLFFIIFISWQ